MNKIEELKKEYQKSKPFPNLILRDFLEEKEAKQLFQELIKEEYLEKKADLFHFFQTNDLRHSSNKKIKEFYDKISSSSFIEFVSKITSKKLTNHADIFSSVYLSTNFLLCHDDMLERRKVAYILYLGENFKEKDGGSLILREDNDGVPGKIAKKILPKNNQLVIFEVSKKSWHEVEEVISKKNRLAVGGWLY